MGLERPCSLRITTKTELETGKLGQDRFDRKRSIDLLSQKHQLLSTANESRCCLRGNSNRGKPLFEAASSFAEGKVSPPLSASVGGRKKKPTSFPLQNIGCALAGGLAERVLATVLL